MKTAEEYEVVIRNAMRPKSKTCKLQALAIDASIHLVCQEVEDVNGLEKPLPALFRSFAENSMDCISLATLTQIHSYLLITEMMECAEDLTLSTAERIDKIKSVLTEMADSMFDIGDEDEEEGEPDQ